MFLLFDIGGTATRMALSQAGDKIDEVILFPTNHNFSEAMEKMNGIAMKFSKGEKYHAVVGGVRSYNKKKGTLFHQPNFPLWVDEPLLEKMRQMWGTDVYLENDAALIALGEAVYGAGRGQSIIGYITLSTGVGGCRVTDGRVDKTVYSFEPGNMIVEGNKYLEEIVSGTAIKQKYGVIPQELEDPVAWDDIARNVALGLNNVAVMWSPEVIILGGSVPQKLDFDKVNHYLSERCKIYPEVPLVKKDLLDEEGGLYGGLAYLRTLP